MADSGTIEGIRMEARSPKTLRDALAQGTTSITQSVDYNAPAPINTSGFHDSIISADGSVSLDSSPFLEQEESLHSTSERNYMNTFHDIERSRFPPQNTLQEVSYLASLSSMSQSMMSTFEDPRRIGVSPASRHFAITASDGTNLLGTEFLPTAMSPGPSMRSTHTAMSPGPSMRSGHSLAQSIISVSPRGDTPQHNPDFDYLTKSPSRLSGVDAEPSEQSNHKKELPEKEHGSDEVQPSEVAPSQVAQEVNGKEEKDKARKDTIMMSHSNCSARSSSPPGFLFKDNEDDSDAILVAPDPAGTSFDVDAYAIPEDLFEGKLKLPNHVHVWNFFKK